MKVMFVSQCEKNALNETRRILDQFAERKGSGVWQTNITLQGLETVKRLLKSTARRNTAVACHLLRGSIQTEVLWIIGNSTKFNRDGSIPTNVTERDILKSQDENGWSTGTAIALLTSLAGLFHDFGKANKLFQSKLRGTSEKTYEPFRHEWISLLLFKKFVGSCSDKEWLEKLSIVTPQDDIELLTNYKQNLDDLKKNPLDGLPNIAKFIGWLILSHHRLPVIQNDFSKSGIVNQEPRLESINEWKDCKRFTANWNSPQCENKWEENVVKAVIDFPDGTPFQSKIWCRRANHTAKNCLRNFELLNRNWFEDRFSMHLMRVVLMLSDHFYSSQDAEDSCRDPNYKPYANTYTKTRTLKQKLDEHNIQVARYAFLISKSLPKLHDTLPTIQYQKEFKKRTRVSKFLWQNEAFDLANSLKEKSSDRGFFGVNLASTGCGKTFANARIMYGLSDEKKGCRFSVALGLRVLTLQTGEALRSRLKIDNDDIAVMIGSQAFQDLFEMKNNLDTDSANFISNGGSESLDDMADDDFHISYDGGIENEYLNKWFGSKPKHLKMISAPILVSTIDHLTPSTESLKGGHQIAPILRLLTSDLVLDEPDDFDISDLPALCRLVNFAGVFGSRVLLSSATLPPAIVKALFEAYSEGRKAFNKVCRNPEVSPDICCAWFDEFGVMSRDSADSESYMNTHSEFVKKRISKLDQQPVLRRAALVNIIPETKEEDNVIEAVADGINNSIYDLHQRHHQIHPKTGARVSFGLVRMANISSMVTVVKEILSKKAADDCCIHFCVYHSQFPMIIRSKIEEILDVVLQRHNKEAIWRIPEIEKAIASCNVKNHIFVVFATPVAEVGRDHDYDWAIVEPSSMRSIIQLAGRVQRHRQIAPTIENILILNKNIKGLKGCSPAYLQPGFESERYSLASKDLNKILMSHQFNIVDSKPRLCISEEPNYQHNLVDLEHVRLQESLLGQSKTHYHANLWWKSNVDWCGEIQRQTKFRKQNGKFIDYIQYIEDEGDEPKLSMQDEKGNICAVGKYRFKTDFFNHAAGNYPWIECDIKLELKNLSIKQGVSLREASVRYGRVSLRELDKGVWMNHPLLGFYQDEDCLHGR
jgi:CRISPR-associated endonuclease/helicase Cas3